MTVERKLSPPSAHRANTEKVQSHFDADPLSEQTISSLLLEPILHVTASVEEFLVQPWSQILPRSATSPRSADWICPRAGLLHLLPQLKSLVRCRLLANHAL